MQAWTCEQLLKIIFRGMQWTDMMTMDAVVEEEIANRSKAEATLGTRRRKGGTGPFPALSPSHGAWPPVPGSHEVSPSSLPTISFHSALFFLKAAADHVHQF